MPARNVNLSFTPIRPGLLPGTSMPTPLHRTALALFDATTFATAALAEGVPKYSSAFCTQQIATDGAMIHVRAGGSGPAVVLLHGFGDTGDMWARWRTHLPRSRRW